MRVATSEARRRSVRHADAVRGRFGVDPQRLGRLTRSVLISVAEK